MANGAEVITGKLAGAYAFSLVIGEADSGSVGQLSRLW